MNDWYYPSDREHQAESEVAYYKWYAPQLEARVRVLQARVDELETQLFIAHAEPTLPVVDAMELEAVPTIRQIKLRNKSNE